VENNLAAGKFKLEGNVNEPVQLFADFGLLRRWDEQQNESAAARAQQFSAKRPRRARLGVKPVHLRVGNLVAQFALGAPRFMQQFAEWNQAPSAAQDFAALVNLIPELVQQRRVL